MAAVSTVRPLPFAPKSRTSQMAPMDRGGGAGLDDVGTLHRVAAVAIPINNDDFRVKPPNATPLRRLRASRLTNGRKDANFLVRRQIPLRRRRRRLSR